jgi:hypothetical protein
MRPRTRTRLRSAVPGLCAATLALTVPIAAPAPSDGGVKAPSGRHRHKPGRGHPPHRRHRLIAAQGKVAPPVPSSSAPVGEATAPPEPGTTAPPEPGTRFFGPTSIWNAELPPDAPIDPNSSEMISALVEEVTNELAGRVGPWLNTTMYSVPIYTVPADQPAVQVRLESPYAATALRSALSAVPLPSGAQPAAGSDHSLVVWQPSTDRLWEFWRLAESDGAWTAFWGGAMEDVSNGSGVFGPESWPGATDRWGASASGLPLVGGLITMADLERGSIDHALAISLPQIRSGVFASPAQRSDGNSPSALALPEGARLRLPPGLDLAALHLPPVTLMLAEAAQRYGIVVRDRAANITFNAQVPTPGMPNPYAGPEGLLEGRSPLELMAAFPWRELQVTWMSLDSGG